MRKAFLALFVAIVSTCALALGGGVAGASTQPSLPGFEQNQAGQNSNKTDQQSQASATDGSAEPERSDLGALTGCEHR